MIDGLVKYASTGVIKSPMFIDDGNRSGMSPASLAAGLLLDESEAQTYFYRLLRLIQLNLLNFKYQGAKR